MVVASPRLVCARVAVCLVLRAHAGVAPFRRLAQALARAGASFVGLNSADVAARVDPRLAYGSYHVPGQRLIGRESPLISVGENLKKRRLIAVDAVEDVDRGHVGRAEAVVGYRSVAFAQELPQDRFLPRRGSPGEERLTAKADECAC